MLRDYLVTDRTAADVARGRQLLALFDKSGVWRGTQGQLRELEASRGFYTASDMNRVERAVEWLLGRLWRYGYTASPPETGAVLIDVAVTPPGTGRAAGGLFYVGETAVLTASPQGGPQRRGRIRQSRSGYSWEEFVNGLHTYAVEGRRCDLR